MTLLRQAEEWQGLLDAGFCRSFTEVGSRFRVSRTRVRQVVSLLKLHPAIRAAIVELDRVAPRGPLTERRLRALTRVSHERQLAELRWLVRTSA